MSTLLEYKGYFGSVEYSDEDEVFHGRLEFIRDLVTYEGRKPWMTTWLYAAASRVSPMCPSREVSTSVRAVICIAVP